MPSRSRRTVLSAALLAAVTAAGLASSAGAAAAPPTYSPGAAGVGDSYFPLEGNGGYDVGHYDLDLAYQPAQHQLSGTVTATATATQNLSRFDLDLSGMAVDGVTVDGTTARFHRVGQELQITPRSGILSGSAFSVAVTYHGSPKTIVGSPIVFGAPYGWQYTKDGAFVGDEPNAASTWFPVNDHPSDKATYTFDITVPSSRQVVANGDLLSSVTNGGRTTWRWDETSPMASYLATIDIGRWTYQNGKTPGGIRETMASDPALADQVAQRKVFALTGQITDYWSQKFGPYSFTSTGAIVDNVPKVGFSLETQTRPLYGFAPDQGTMSHELSHQWFGDAVSVQQWKDIWLNEGFATFAANLWYEHVGQGTTYTDFTSDWRKIPATSGFWDQAIADPQRDTMFSGAVYERGGMTLAALRHKIGDGTFFTLLQTWVDQHRYGNASTQQFIDLANQVSGRNLDGFFQTWLYDKTKPATF